MVLIQAERKTNLSCTSKAPTVSIASRIAWLFVLSFWFQAAPATCQEGQEEKVRVEGQNQGGRREPGQKSGDAGQGETKEDPGADGTGAVGVAAPGEALANSCSVLAMLNPPRLAPGETGTLTLICALQHRSVIQAEANWKLTYAPTQGEKGEIILGAWQLKPPGLGTLEEKFKGKPVYDNQASIQIPVSIAAGTPFGKYRISTQLEVPLTDGSTGQVLGLYKTQAGVEVQVGAAMPRPIVRGAQPKTGGIPVTAGPGDTVTPGVAPVGSDAGKGTSPKATPPVGQGARPQPVTKPAGVSDGAPANSAQGASDLTPGQTPDEPGEPRSFPILPIAAGAGVLLLLIAVLARRKG